MLTQRCQIIAECASNHGGDMVTLTHMIQAAALNGADFVKFQAYQTKFLNPADPQFAWLRQAELTDEHIHNIVNVATIVKITPMFSVFDEERADRLRTRGVRHFKVGHANQLPTNRHPDDQWYQSVAWGLEKSVPPGIVTLRTAPLYPAPLSTIAALYLEDGYSDHCIGQEGCKIMMARGVQIVEKHFSIDGCPRRQTWDMDEQDLSELRRWAEICAEALLGTSQTERWSYASR